MCTTNTKAKAHCVAVSQHSKKAINTTCAVGHSVARSVKCAMSESRTRCKQDASYHRSRAGMQPFSNVMGPAKRPWVDIPHPMIHCPPLGGCRHEHLESLRLCSTTCSWFLCHQLGPQEAFLCQWFCPPVLWLYHPLTRIVSVFTCGITAVLSLILCKMI